VNQSDDDGEGAGSESTNALTAFRFLVRRPGLAGEAIFLRRLPRDRNCAV